jgi:hypothetical protein
MRSRSFIEIALRYDSGVSSGDDGSVRVGVAVAVGVAEGADVAVGKKGGTVSVAVGNSKGVSLGKTNGVSLGIGGTKPGSSVGT